MNENILTKKLKNKIDDICQDGDMMIIDSYDYQGAIVKFEEALALVPHPQEEFETTTWIYTAIGDAYYLDDKFDLAFEKFIKAYKMPQGENGFIFFRLGQCYLKQNEMDLAKEYLYKAYTLAGEELFVENEQDTTIIDDLIK